MATNIDLQKVKTCFLKKLAGDITAEEERFLQEWIQSSPQNRALADRIFSEEFLISAIETDERLAADTVWQKIYHQLHFTKKHFLWMWWVAAAMVTMAVVSFFIYQDRQAIISPGTTRAVLYDLASHSIDLPFEHEGDALDFSKHMIQYSRQHEKVDLKADLHRTIVVPYGGEYRILLEDSSLIHLGPGSSLAIPVDFSKENRTVNLSGEAYLSIHKDPQHPFVVQTARANVRVLGTQLNIEAYDDERQVRILLEQGRLEVQSATETQQVPVGSMAVIGDDKHIQLAPANVYEVTAWHHNKLVFENQPLDVIMKKLARWYHFEVAYSSDRLRNLHFTMDVNKYDTFNKLAKAIEKMGELKIEIKNKNVVLISERNLNQD